MSDYHYRWMPLAEFNFFCEGNKEFEDRKYVFCMCSRVFIRDGIQTYADKDYGSESDLEIHNSPSKYSQEYEDHSHVHFSVDTSYKVKCEKDEGASCYCSASHTDNYCSTDEHDPAQAHGLPSHALQPSDSGADLTYQECHSDYIQDKIHKMDQDGTPDTDENYLSEDTWDKFWAVHGERLIWASWIKKYSDYINPAYLDENNDLLMDDNNLPKPHSSDQICNKEQTETDSKAEQNGRERKFSYDSKVNPYKRKELSTGDIKRGVKSIEISDNKEDTWVPVSRRRSCSEHERILSPRTVEGTDSMTNVTKITLSSYDVTSSHVTSPSSPTEDYSVSSSTSDDPSHDQTRIANVDDNMEQAPLEEMDNELYWQFLWKKHFGEQLAWHYANYILCHENKKKEQENITIESVIEKKNDLLEVECENSEGNSQEIPSVVEVPKQVEETKLDESKPKKKTKSRRKNNRIVSSVGVLLQNLLKEHQNDSDSKVTESGDSKGNEATEPAATDTAGGYSQTSQAVEQNKVSGNSFDDGDDEPPEEKSVSLKRGHENDEQYDIDEENEDYVEEYFQLQEEIHSTFRIMGFQFDAAKMPSGDVVSTTRVSQLRPPRCKKFASSKKTYFDDDGNAIIDYQCHESEEEKEVKTEDDDELELQLEIDKENEINSAKSNDGPDNNAKETNEIKEISDSKDTVEAYKIPLPVDVDFSSSDAPENKEEEVVADSVKNTTIDQMKRKRRQRRQSRHDSDRKLNEDMPEDIRNDPKMRKYWKKRHSLFHRFDEGIRLDRESWFSVTPQNVARHIATKTQCNVVLDGFCGAGGNTIQFATLCKKVIAIDIDPVKIELAKHNARVYGVEDRIEFIVGDFFELAPNIKADMVFLSPPWGGPKYSKNKVYDIETMLEPKSASELMRTAQLVTKEVTMYLPRNTSTDQILAIAQTVGGTVDIEQSFLEKRFVAITAYFY